MKSMLIAISISVCASGCFHYSVIKDRREDGIEAESWTLGLGHGPDPVRMAQAREQWLRQTHEEVVFKKLRESSDPEERARLEAELKLLNEQKAQSAQSSQGFEGTLSNNTGSDASLRIVNEETSTQIAEIRIGKFQSKVLYLPTGTYTMIWRTGAGSDQTTKRVDGPWGSSIGNRR